MPRVFGRTPNPSALGANLLNPRFAVRNLPVYRPPLGDRTGLRLDFNENTVGCSPQVLRRIRSLDMEHLSRYPDREPVEAVAATHLAVSPQELLLTNGVDEAIHLLCQTYLEVGHEALIVVPTFSMYEICAAATGARVISIPADRNFNFPTDAVLGGITSKTRLIVVANPNNPTGTLAPPDDLLRITADAPASAMLVDEAYFEFCGRTLAGKWHDFPNLFVARTFSKAYGLAGLRVGVLMGDQGQMAAVRRVASPYNVNCIALDCLPEALADQRFVDRYVAEVCEGRRRLQEELAALEIRFWPSRANFVLLHLGEALSPFIRAMRERGILLRDRSRDQGCAGCVRITIGSLTQTDQLLKALREVLEQLPAREGMFR